jgi:hypothetical protein
VTVSTLLPSGVGTVAENWPLGGVVCTTVVLSVADPGCAVEIATWAPGTVAPVTVVEPTTVAPLAGELIVTGTFAGGPLAR